MCPFASIGLSLTSKYVLDSKVPLFGESKNSSSNVDTDTDTAKMAAEKITNDGFITLLDCVRLVTGTFLSSAQVIKHMANETITTNFNWIDLFCFDSIVIELMLKSSINWAKSIVIQLINDLCRIWIVHLLYSFRRSLFISFSWHSFQFDRSHLVAMDTFPMDCLLASSSVFANV